MANFTERTELAQEEQLDWLHQQHVELAAQTDLLRQQVRLLTDIHRHTALVYVVLAFYVIVTVIGVLVFLANAFLT